jgi:Zn-dependent peptidase ImmA (M78 family)
LAELLMPFKFLEKHLQQLSVDIESEDAVAQLAQKYQVSVQAMTIRLSALRVLACGRTVGSFTISGLETCGEF